MSHIDDHLRPEEKVLYVAHPTRVTLVLPCILAILFLAGGAILYQRQAEPVALIAGASLAAVLVIWVLMRMMILRSNHYVLTDHRLMKITGILTRRSTDAHLEKINNVEHRQTLWGRILGFGDVEVDTASESGMTVFPNISRPLAFKSAVLAAAEGYRNMRSGGTIAPTGATRLRELKGLLDEGLITQEEFNARRAKLVEEL